MRSWMPSGHPAMVQLLLSRGANVRPAHVDDARKGAHGEFAWTGALVEHFPQIEALLAGRPDA